jgi:predicted metalloprotease
MHKKQPQKKKSFDKYGVVQGKKYRFLLWNPEICAKLGVINLMEKLGVDDRQAGG